MMSATEDLLRRMTLSVLLSKLVRIETIDIATSQDIKFIPRLDVNSNTSNIYAWLYARLIVQNFGVRALHRIDTYIGSYLIIALILTAIFLSRIFTASNPWECFDSVTNIQILLLMLTIFLFLCAHIYTASLVNDEYFLHRQIIALNATKFESQTSFESTKLTQVTGMSMSIEKTNDHINAFNRCIEATRFFASSSFYLSI